MWEDALNEFLAKEFELEALKKAGPDKPGGVTTGYEIARMLLTGEGTGDI